MHYIHYQYKDKYAIIKLALVDHAESTTNSLIEKQIELTLENLYQSFKIQKKK